MTIDEFIARIQQRDMPTNPMARLKTLAKELAEGTTARLWRVEFTPHWAFTQEGSFIDELDLSDEQNAQYIPSAHVRRYLAARWPADDHLSNVLLLLVNGYVRWQEAGMRQGLYVLTKAAFDLLEEAETANIFISYKRSESSAFALLVLTKLKQAGLNPFLDMAITPGDNWRDHLRERIEQSDYLILLLGKETLNSSVTREEIAWALDHNVTLVPIWHNGFSYRRGTWPDISVELDRVLAETHTIRVLEENPMAYNNAIIELLNRFGIMP